MKRKKTPPKKKTSYTRLWNPDSNTQLDIFTHGGQVFSTPLSMPSQVRIYGQRYKVFYHSKIYNAPKKSERLRGVVLYGARIIFLDPDQSIHDLKETLYHEVGHVYLKVWQTKSEALTKITHNQMEDFCDLIGEAVPDLVGNNSLSFD